MQSNKKPSWVDNNSFYSNGLLENQMTSMATGGYKDSDGKFHPINPNTKGGVSAKVGESKPQSKLSKHLGSLKIVGQKVHGAGKKAKEKHDNYQENKKEKRESLELQLDDILFDDNISDLKKFQMMQPLITKNYKALGKDNIIIYNKRLAELHEQIKRSPDGSRKSVNHDRPQPTHRENDPFEPSRRPSADDNAINRAHDEMLKHRARNQVKEEADDLSPETKAQIAFSSLT
mgnify:CR=1 FL=1